MIDMLLKLFKALNSNASPWQLAFAIAFGMIVGLSPFYSFHNLLILLIICLVRVNMSAFFLAVMFFTGLAYMIDTQAIKLGESLLTNPDYFTFWTELYQSDFWRLTHYNHTLTLGSLVISLILFIPIAVGSKILIVTYRHRFMAWVNQLKVIEMLKASRLFAIYKSFSD
ncbi:MAG: TIGR03546 family protein [Ghiorsea sp.]|nr:TIGR03546 family protein [Ghiorsea sp.]